MQSPGVLEPGDSFLKRARGEERELGSIGRLNKLFKPIVGIQSAGTSMDVQIAKILKYFFTDWYQWKNILDICCLGPPICPTSSILISRCLCQSAPKSLTSEIATLAFPQWHWKAKCTLTRSWVTFEFSSLPARLADMASPSAGLQQPQTPPVFWLL